MSLAFKSIPLLNRRLASLASPAVRKMATSAVAIRSGDIVQLRLPIPQSGVVRDTEFHLPAASTVGDVINHILRETDDAVAVEAFGADSKPLEKSKPLTDVMNSSAPFAMDLQIGGTKLRILPSHQGMDALNSGAFDLSAVSYQSKLSTLREALVADSRSQISVDDFLKICGEYGLHGNRAQAALADLHRTGAILHFTDKELKHTVLIKPDEVMAVVYGKFGLRSPMDTRLEKHLQTLEEKRRRLVADLAPHLKLKGEIDETALRAVGWGMWGLTAFSFSGFGLYWYLVYELFSWDIMEPITFFTGLAVSGASYAWWSWTNRSSENESIHEYFLERSQAKRYKRRQLDTETIAAIQHQLAELQRDVQETSQRQFTLRVLGELPKH